MEHTKKLTDVEPDDLAVVQRLFGCHLEPSTGDVLILRTGESESTEIEGEDDAEAPPWCDVLEGFTQEDLAEFRALLNEPVRFGQSC